MSKSTKRISLILVMIFVSLFCCVLCGCTERPEDYTLEEHIARITPRIEKRYINPETRQQKYNQITGYKLYPLYDYEDKLHYFLIEFEPYGFAFVSLNIVSGIFNRQMYRCDETYLFTPWQHVQTQNRSPYFVAEVFDKKMYFLDVYYGYIPAIKQNNKFINLISMDEIEYQNRKFYEELGTEYVSTNISPLSVSFFAGLGGEL